MAMHHWLWVLASVFVALDTWTLATPLRSIPGPRLWSYTNTLRWYYQYFDGSSAVLKHLHKEYGALVRIGPNTVSLSDPTLAPKVYGTCGEFRKVKIGYGASTWSMLIVQRLSRTRRFA
jgi:hypothetical protein